MVPQSMINKAQQLSQLAQKRRNTRWDGFDCLSDFHNGAYECDYVSPFTKSANNIDSEVMLILQDWASSDFLNQPLDDTLVVHGHDPKLPTNINLNRLLVEHLSLSLSDTYATNLFPFVKRGGMSAAIPKKALKQAALEFAKPQIDIINPKAVVCFGLATFNALSRCFGGSEYRTIGDAIENPLEINGGTLFCQAHPGQLGQNNRNKGGVNRVGLDWARLLKLLKSS